jgi:serine/threonine protein kinase
MASSKRWTFAATRCEPVVPRFEGTDGVAATASIMAKGATLGGYRIEDIVGIGGMAVVYRSEQLSLGRAVALKVLAPQLSTNETFHERFRRAGKHVAALAHPDEVPIYDAGDLEDRLWRCA